MENDKTKLNNETLKKYRSHYEYWKEKAIFQLTFFNNLLMTIGIGFISIAYNHLTPSKTNSYDIVNKISFIVIIISIILGIFLGYNRVKDFRISRNICQTKYRVNRIHRLKMTDAYHEKFTIIKRLLLLNPFLCSIPIITKEDCNNYKLDKVNIDNKLKRLRDISYNLGELSWKLTFLQIVSLIIGLILYTLRFICN